MSTQSKLHWPGQMLQRKTAKSPSKRPALRHDAWSSVNSRQPKSIVKLLKQSPSTQYPEMVAPDYDPSEPERSISPIVQELTKIKKRVKEVLTKYETPNPNHGQYEILLDDRDYHEKELIKLMTNIDQYSEERDDVLCELIESFSEQLASLDDLNLAQVIEKISTKTSKTASEGGSSTNLTGSLPSLPDEGSRQYDSLANTDGSTVADKAPVNHDSITTAKNLARIFSLEDRLKQGLKFSQDKFSSKIPQLLMEDEALLEEVVTEQVLKAVKVLKLYIVIEMCLENIRKFCDTIPREVKEVEELMAKSGDRLRNMYLGYFCEVSDYVKEEATSLRKNMAKLYIILDSYDPERNSQIQKEDNYTALINMVFQCSLLMEKKLCTYFEGYSDVQEWILEAGKEVRGILQSKAQEAQVLSVKMRQLFNRPNNEILELQEEMSMLDVAVRYLSHSLAQEEESHKVLGALMELSQCIDMLAKRGKLGFTLQISELLEKNVVEVLEKQQIRIPSRTVCTELHDMGFSPTILSLDQTKEGTNTGAKIKYLAPMLGVKNSPGPIGLKKRVARNSTSFNHQSKRSQAKISVKKTRKITKPETIRPSLSHQTDHKEVMVPNSHRSHCDRKEHRAVVTAQQPGRILSKKSSLQNRAPLLSNTDPHDSNLQCREENTSIRYSRRMPMFPPVSSSHVNTQPVTSNQCRVSLIGEGGGRKARFTGQTTKQLVEGKCLLSPAKLSVVSLKLPNIIN